MSEAELELQRLTKRLEDEKDALSSRIRKRIYQKIGKLKKEIASNPAPKPSANPVLQKNEEPEKEEVKKAPLKKHQLEPKEKEESEKKRIKQEQQEPLNPSSTVSTNTASVAKQQTAPSTMITNITDTTKPTHYTKKEQKAIIHLLNKELKECAIKKQLNKAKKAFRQHCAKGLIVDIQTYSNLLNVYIRCQDIEGARNLFQTIPNPNLVTYTILLRGYCESGMMLPAKHLFFDEMIPSKQWNIRSLNTFLRGCLRTGFIETAIKAFEHYQNHHNHNNQRPDKLTEAREVEEEHEDQEKNVIDDDEGDEDDQLQLSACYESMVSLLTRSGRLPQALSLLQSYLAFTNTSNTKHRSDFLVTNASLTSIIAKFLTVFGFFSEARKFLLLTEEILARKDFHPLATSAGGGGGGEDVTLSHQRSVQLFQKFQKQEVRGLLEQCEEYMSRVASASSHSLTSEGEERRQMSLSIEFYRRLLSQVLYIGFHPSNCDNEAVEAVDSDAFYDHLTAAITKKFGYSGLSVEQLLQVARLRGGKEESKTSHGLLESLVEEVKQRMKRIFKPKADSPSIVSTLPSSSQSTLVDSQLSESAHAQTYEIDIAELFSHTTSSDKKDGEDGKRADDGENQSGKVEEKSYEKSLEEYYRFLDQQEDKDDDDHTGSGHNLQTSSSKGGSSSKSKKSKRAVPVCLEIGSGNGDWVVAQASADRQLVEIEEEIKEKEDVDEDSEDEENDDENDEEIEEEKGTKKKITIGTLQKEKEREKRKRQQQQQMKRNNKNKNKLTAGKIENNKRRRRTRRRKVWQVRSNWIALELRFDRVSNILTNHYLDLALLSSHHQNQSNPSNSNTTTTTEEGDLPPNNLAIMSGDATTVLHRYLATSSIDHIFVNYPQPPERITAGMHGKDQGKHLYTPDVLQRMTEVLEEGGGLLTILSDNLLYIQLLANNLLQIAEHTVTLARKKQRGRGRVGLAEEERSFVLVSEELAEMENVRRVQEILPIVSLASNTTSTSSPPAIVIYRGDPGDDCGHHSGASSYFDRMWNLGQKKRRWFLHLRKTQV